MLIHILSLSLLISSILASLVLPRSVENGPCTGANGALGVCVSISSCDRDNGTYIHNACPSTPDNIKCCTKPTCQLEAQKGDCRWVQDCGGGKPILRNLCPGPDAYRCCVTNGVGAGMSAVAPSATMKPKPKPKPTKNIGQKILDKAKEAKGIPYHWAGGNCKGPTGGGFDCSGLVSWAVCQVTGRDLFSEGLRVTRSMYCASEKKRKYKKVKFADRRAGDAVFFGGACNCKTNPAGIHHVGLMMDSGYNMWNALKTGTRIRKDNFKNWNEEPCPYVIRFE